MRVEGLGREGREGRRGSDRVRTGESKQADSRRERKHRGRSFTAPSLSSSPTQSYSVSSTAPIRPAVGTHEPADNPPTLYLEGGTAHIVIFIQP